MTYIFNEGKTSYYNMALEEYLFHSRTDLHPILLLWQNSGTIVVGRNQNTIKEINLDYVKENGIDVVRRLTGGGAVYHDKGNLNYTYITDADSGGKFDFTPFIQNVIGALDHFGVRAEFTGRNDITVDGKKFSGNAQVRHKKSLMHHGTIMVNSDLTTVSKCLNPSKVKLKDKGIQSVSSRICNLSEYLPENVGIDRFKDQLIRQFEYSSGGDMVEYVLSEEEIDEVWKLARSKYELWQWNYGKSPAFDISGERRFDFGTMQLQLLLEENRIKEVYLYGDFFSKKDVGNLEKYIAGTVYDRHSILNKLNQIDLSDYIDGLMPDDLISLMF